MTIHYQITEKNAVDDFGNTLEVGKVITIGDDKIPPRLVNKGIIINPAVNAQSEKELVVATPSEEDTDDEETAIQKQERLNRRGKQRAKVQ